MQFFLQGNCINADQAELQHTKNKGEILHFYNVFVRTLCKKVSRYTKNYSIIKMYVMSSNTKWIQS